MVSPFNRFPHVWHVHSGGHTCSAWKNDLYLLSQRLFRGDAPPPTAAGRGLPW